MEDKKLFLTTKEVMKKLRLDRATVIRMLHDGRLKGKKMGPNTSPWRIYPASLDALLK